MIPYCEHKEETQMTALRINSFTHIVATVMTGRGLHNGFRGKDWYSKRIGIFRDYVIDNLKEEGFFSNPELVDLLIAE